MGPGLRTQKALAARTTSESPLRENGIKADPPIARDPPYWGEEEEEEG